MLKKGFEWMSLARILIIVAVVGIRLIIRQDWLGNLLLVVGWVIGYILAEADHVLYVVVNTHELTAQRIRKEILENRNWGSAWKVLKDTERERTRLPVHNVVTGLIVASLGVWMVTSSASVMGNGVVVGLGVKLFLDFLATDDYKKWYWVFARQFTERQNLVMMSVWGGLTLLELWQLCI